jgi:hypothetical protein
MRYLILAFLLIPSLCLAGEKEEAQLQRAFYLQLIRANEAEAELARIRVRELDAKLNEMKMKELKANPKKDTDQKDDKEISK